MILFSAIGGHDPIANFQDGSMLHICRVYRPRKVFLYFSKEMGEREDADQRYTKTLKMLAEENDFFLQVVPHRTEHVQVQLYDLFYQEFDSLLHALHEENPTEEILLNISSGTPAMKNALNIIAALSPYGMKAIQVPTPTRKENVKIELPSEYDTMQQWELNEDRNKDFVNRCLEVQNLNLLAKIQKETIFKMVQAYDYHGALTLADEAEEFLSPKAHALLQYAQYRYMLDRSNANRVKSAFTISFLPKLSLERDKIFEYILTLQIKQRRQEYADFLRAITPVILDLFEACLFEKKQIDLKNYCEKNAKDVLVLKQEKFTQDAIGREVLDVLERGLGGYDSTLRAIPYTSYHVKILLDHYCSDQPELLEQVALLRMVEENARSVAAHEIQSVTEKWILKCTGSTTTNILKAIRSLMKHAGFNVNSKHWNSYDAMNEQIKKELFSS